MDLTKTPLGHIATKLASLEDERYDPADIQYRGDMSAPVAKQWLKNTLAITLGTGVGLGGGYGLSALAKKYGPRVQGADNRTRLYTGLGGLVGTLGTGAAVALKEKQRELLERAEQEAAQRTASERPGGQV